MFTNVSPGIFLGLVLILIIGCKRSENNESSENEISFPSSANSRVFRGGINYSVEELPLSKFVQKNLEYTESSPVKDIEADLSGERVYQVEFLHLTGEDLLQSKFTSLDYSNSVQYLSSKISSDFFIITSNKDTIESSGVIFERNFKVAPYKRVLVFFSGIQETQVDLLYNDRLFGNGHILFPYQDLNL